MMTIQVGSVVRAPRAATKRKKRAVVATLPDEDGKVCILWEDVAPRPLGRRRFLVTPMVPHRKDEEREETVCQSVLGYLLDFEENKEEEASVAVWKERGDALLRLGDASAAIPFYEAGLSASSILQVGSSVLVSDKETIQVAEVDCLEEDCVDVTIGKVEATMRASNVKLCLCPGQESRQVRILLNLTRCLMQVADLDGTQMSAYYRRSAATACSMSLAILDALEQAEPSLHAMTLLLRSKAYASRSKWTLAMEDATLLTTHHPDNKEGSKWLSRLESEIARHKKTNQKLAKSMCRWVQTATATTGAANMNNERRRESETMAPSRSVSRVQLPENMSRQKRSQSSFVLWCQLLVPLLLALWIYDLLSG
jgi:Skp family chaperone for outer membrane proteins